MTTKEDVEFLTMTEAAEEAGLSYETVRRYKRDGRMPEPTRMWGKPVWTKAEIRAWVKTREEIQQ